MKSIFSRAVLAVLLTPPALHAQLPNAQARPFPGNDVVRTYRLTAATTQADQNETLTAIRNILPSTTRVFLVPSQNAIVLLAAPDVQEQMAMLLRELDQPHHDFRVTFTFTESENGKRIGVQHYSMMLSQGQHAQFKQGSRIPILVATGKDAPEKNQTAYVDVGLNFDATAVDYAGGMQLKSKIERSALAEEQSGLGMADPIIRQTLLEGVATLMPGKETTLGSLDVPGSPRHIDVTASYETVRR